MFDFSDLFSSNTRFGWYFIRLKKMNLMEIPYRLYQKLLIKIDKYRYCSKFSSIIESLHKALTLDKHTTSSINDFSDPSNHIFSDMVADKENILNEISSISKNTYEIFGREFYFHDPIEFHLDPVTDDKWPLKFWDDIEYRSTRPYSGIKFAWEINRLHHWPKIAVAYRISNDDKYLFEFISQLKQWLTANPYPYGINWISGIELGIRVVNLYITLKILSLNKSQYQKLLSRHVDEFIKSHGRHLYRYPSKHSSAANHALAESLGLFFAGAGFPNQKHAAKWEKKGKQIFEHEILRQLYSDGSSFEHSIPYLQFVADHALIYCWMARCHNIPINPEIYRRIGKVCEFIAHIIDTKGNIPMIGDDDDGYLVKLWFGGHNNFSSILKSGAMLFSRPDWIHPESQSDMKAAYFGSLKGDNLNALTHRADKWTNKSRYFEQAGLGIIASHQDGTNILFVGNSGPLGLSPLSGHGHADALSFWLSVNGCPFFVDPGTYLYHGGGAWRRYFRSTRAHNTIVVDHLDQSEQVADFIFDQFYNIENPKFKEDSDKIVWGGQHDGYKRLEDPVIHAREVAFYKSKNVFYIKDRLLCSRRHEIMLLFHLYPAIKVEYQHPNSFCLSHGATRLELKVHGEYSDKVYRGSENPLFGWYSSGFNRIEETSTIVLSRVIDGETIIESEVIIS